MQSGVSTSKKSARSFWLFLLIVLITLAASYLFVVEGDNQASVALPLSPLYRDESLSTEKRIASLLSHMTLEEKIGQMTLVEKNSLVDMSDIDTYHLGALLSGAGAKPAVNTKEGWFEMISGYQTVAEGSRLAIPLLYGSDAIHGHGHMEGATVFPHAIGLGASGDEELVKAVANATAQELRASGVNWNFAPNLDQPGDIRWGRVYETFSDDKAIVSNLGAAYLTGLQTGEMYPNGSRGQMPVLGTLKHYVGLGSMGWDTSKNTNFKIDQGVTVAEEAQLRSDYLPAFKAGMDAGALSVMVGLNTWEEKRLVTSHYWLTDVLKEELNFDGFVVSDWYGVHEGRRNTFLATVQAVNAGVDMVMLPFDYKTFARHMWWANRLGLISDERIDDAVTRILRAKFALGLFDAPTKASTDASSVGSLEHLALAREAVAKSLVLLKNEDNVLPIAPTTRHIRVVGSAADNVGRQSGAWTVEWQGVDGNWLPGGTSILAGIKKAAPTALIEYDLSGNFKNMSEKADIGIAVVGEAPYAEGWGDREYPILSDEDLSAIKRLQAVSDRVVVVIVSGRPLLIADEIDSWDGVIAAWLPGSAGAGVADGLFGVTPFTGTLPLPWPHHSEQLPITTEGKTADGTDVLFPRGFGL